MIEFPCKIDCGCGNFKKEGFIGIDKDNIADIVWDATNGLPLPDNSVSELYTSHFLEHLMPVDIHFVLLEIFRVCQNGATVEIRVPYYDTPEGGLPCHYSKLDKNFIDGIGIWVHDEKAGKWQKEDIRIEGYTLIGIFKIIKNI